MRRQAISSLLIAAAATSNLCAGCKPSVSTDAGSSAPPAISSEAPPGPVGPVSLAATTAAIPVTQNTGTAGDAAKLLRDCRAAYAALTSYQGTSRMESTAALASGAVVPDTDTPAIDITYVRPGKIRISGAIPSLNTRYDIVSDGKSCWERFPAATSSPWSKAYGIDLAIAKARLHSKQVATTIPDILLNREGIEPAALKDATLVSGGAVTTTVNGRPAYQIESKNRYGDETIWIDTKTLLMVKVRTKREIAKVNAAMAPGIGSSDVKGYNESIESFTNVRINAPIAPSTFARPKGAPAP